MYVPDIYAADAAQARSLVESHAFGLLVAVGDDGIPEIAHVPFLLDAGEPFGTLRAHVARANRVSTLLDRPRPVTAVFQGPHAYVTPRWCASPAKQVPTWNYVAVHVRGIARRIDDESEVTRVLADLTARYEADAADPWTLETLDPRDLARRSAAITAFTVQVERVDAKFKLGQNMSAAERERVIGGLGARGGPDDRAVASLMASVAPRS